MKNEISSKSLVWLSFGACVLAAIWAQPSSADIQCYTDFGEQDALTTHSKGKYAMKTCTSRTNMCYESYPKKMENPEIYRSFYKCGCTDIGCNKKLERCRSCNTSLCNDKLADLIRATSRHCWRADKASEKTFGERTVFCYPGMENCYYTTVYHEDSRLWVFNAGCGNLTGDPHGIYKEYEDCYKKDLCNFRPHISTHVNEKKDKLPPRPARPNITDIDEDTEPLTTHKPSATPILRECFYNAGGDDFGTNTVKCLHSAQCYYQGYDSENNTVRYNAGCGTCYSCNKCHVCSTNLCNVPPELNDAVQQRHNQSVSIPTKGQSGKDRYRKGKNTMTNNRSQIWDDDDVVSDNSSTAKPVTWIFAALPIVVVYIS